MKNCSAKILTSLLLLFTFVAGQIMVFAHSHAAQRQLVTHYSQKNKSQTVEDGCVICAQHDSVQLFLQQQHQIFFWSVSSSYERVSPAVIYQGIKVLLAGNRGPPALNFLIG